MTIVLQLSVAQNIIFKKVAFSKQHTGTIQDKSKKNHTLFRNKMAKFDTLNL